MFWMPWRMHCLTEPDERACADSTLLRQRASDAAIATSSSDIGVSSAPMPVIASPDRLSLMESTPYLISVRTVRRISSGPDTTMPRFKPSMRDVRGRAVAQPADRGDLRAGRQVARAGEAALVDEALADHVEPRLGGRRAAARR